MSNVQFEVHESHAQLWERDDWRYAIIMGGRGNGRSGTASRYVISQLLGKEYTRGAIMRAVHADIRASCWSELIDRLTEQGINESFRIKDQDMFLERGANSIRAHGFKASSGSLTARLKSLAGYNLVWIEEAEEIGEEEFRKLDDSLRTIKGNIRIILSLNSPPKDHWIIKKWFDLEPSEAKDFYVPKLRNDADNVLFIFGTYEENIPNISPATVKQYENYRLNSPAYYWNMIKGLVPETVTGKIYNNWREVDSIPFGARLMARGVDFGWYPDPAAGVDIYYQDGGYILDEIFYQNEMSNRDMAEVIKGQEKQKLVVADSAEPKSIAELQTEGVNVIPCVKGADSVVYGIKVMQDVPISYTKRSVNLKREYGSYAWKTDKDGEVVPGEVKGPDHALDAARYAMTYIVPMQRRSDISTQRARPLPRKRVMPAR